MRKKQEKGITLIALIITIIIMLILVAVSISISINGNLFNKAGEAARNTDLKVAEENELSNQAVSIIDSHVANATGVSLGGGSEEPDWDTIKQQMDTQYPDTTELFAIGTDGSIVDLDKWRCYSYDGLWRYDVIDGKVGYSLGDGGCGFTGYLGEYPDGKIEGTVPQWIRDTEGDWWPVVSLRYTFAATRGELTEAPIIPSTVTDMSWAFTDCSGLIEAPIIPNGVIDMFDCFYNCTSLTTAPIIPNGVIDMYDCFSNCTSLTTAPVIPSTVANMCQCFCDCNKLTGTIIINANPDDYYGCFSRCCN